MRERVCRAARPHAQPRSYGIGKWRLIQKDPELGAVLRQRSNVDLKARSKRIAAGEALRRPPPRAAR